MFKKRTFGFLFSEVCKIRILARNGLILEVRFFPVTLQATTPQNGHTHSNN